MFSKRMYVTALNLYLASESTEEMKKGANPDIKTFFTPATKGIAHC